MWGKDKSRDALQADLNFQQRALQVSRWIIYRPENTGRESENISGAA